MRRKFIFVVLLSCLLMGQVGFDSTNPVGSAQPDGFSDNIRVEEPYQDETEVAITGDQASKFQMSIESTSENKTYWLGVDQEDSVLVWQAAAGNVIFHVNGEIVDPELRQGVLGKDWLVWQASGDLTVEITPQSGGISVQFLDSPMFYLMSATIVVLLGTTILQYFLQSESEYL